MRVLIINTSERLGGAAVAARRLMKALRNSGINAKMLVRDKQTKQANVLKVERNWFMVWNFIWERIVIWRANRFKRNNLFSVDIANTGADITSLPEFQLADVIHLHWINQGMLSLNNIREILASGKPVVWTMHDMWPCTGICHHARQCQHYQLECRHCPYLYGGGSKNDLSTHVFRKKKALYQQTPITFVTCSKWLEQQAQTSALLTDQTIISIPNPINTNVFAPRNKPGSRIKCNLPLDKKFILFGSVKITDKRKGIDYLIEACNHLASEYPELIETLGVVAFGQQSSQLESLLPFPVYSLDYVNDESDLVNIYNSVDLFVTPSLEENLPNTIMEAMACGVPCVGFQVGGIPEMIDHLHNGYVARYKDSADIANGIYWTLNNSAYDTLSEQAVRKVRNHYSEKRIAKRYIELYNQITKSNE